MRRRLINATLVAAALALTAAAANGQSFARESKWGRVSAEVTDQNGALIIGARVVFEWGGFRREGVLNADYIYEVKLPPGVYSVTARAQGFSAAAAPNVHLKSGDVLRVKIMLNVEPPPQVLNASAQRRKSPPPATKTQVKTPAKTTAQTASSRTSAPGVVNLSTEPGAYVWVDEVRRGTADAEGKLQLKLTSGRHSLRVRAGGFAERTLALLPTQRGAVSVPLTKTTDEAELAFQQAEGEREKGNNAQAVESYRRALKLRQRYAAAHLGLARALESQEEFDAALEELAAARRDRPGYAEASAVEGRILRSLADYDGALNSYRRAIREGRGFQPEAYTGMGIVHEDKGRNEEAAEAFRKAISQLSDTEPILYELLGRNLERLERWKEAVSAYEKYLELVPTGAHASAINSIIDQLRKQAAEAEQQGAPPL